MNILQVPSSLHTNGTYPEKLLTIREAAEIIGCHYWQLQRAVGRGDLPSYRPFNKRRLVKISEVFSFIESSREGGDK
jgi:excisionase family DNA binding protein